MMHCSSSSRSDEKSISLIPYGYQRVFLAWLGYFLLGALHEAVHLLLTRWLLLREAIGSDRCHGGFGSCCSFWLILARTVLGRQTLVSVEETALHNYSDRIFWIRHLGWIFSCSLAIFLHFFLQKRTRKNNGRVIRGKETENSNNPEAATQQALTLMVWAAYATALDAIVTDLLQFAPANSVATTTTTTDRHLVLQFFCGNFGLILLNPAWMNHRQERGNCHSALKILKDMIRVTMMRGAQSGGVVTFENTATANNKNHKELRAIRSRVVNRKRTDLSERVIAKVKQDNHHFYGSSKRRQPSVKTFSGHTRFATTSIANLDGTHPHRWTPRAKRRVYDFQTVQVHTVGVEHYIMHNGDFDFYELNEVTYDLETVQDWLMDVLSCPMPSYGDSCSIAGLVDVLRTQGCFSLSARYALTLGMTTCNMINGLKKHFTFYEKVGAIFEDALSQHVSKWSRTYKSPAQVIEATATDQHLRQDLVRTVGPLLRKHYQELFRPLVPLYLSAPAPDDDHENDDVEQAGDSSHSSKDAKSWASFARATIDAFFDNDLLFTTKTFLANAHGSFGLCVTSTLDAASQMCLAARGQTMSVAFYPKKGIICYGSEQAAVKAGLNAETPGGEDYPTNCEGMQSGDDISNQFASRLDLDDLGGEIALLHWNTLNVQDKQLESIPIVSPPNRHLDVFRVMNGTVHLVLCQQRSNTTSQHRGKHLFHRMTLLEENEFIQPLKPEPKDIVLSDIQSIPRVCHAIQRDWQNEGKAISFNRLSALTLSRCLINRLEAIHHGKIQRQAGTVDVLLTGCEVSLWLAENMAADLQKAFTKLNIMSVSSNKVLGLFGQEQSIPSIGYPMSQKTNALTDSIVIIVSHSGGTFAPLQCSNLLQSTTKNIFAVTSEWDTQVGKQLRAMYQEHDTLAYSSRIFTTGVGLAPAEPCSLSVAATQQLLTNIFEHICIVLISSPQYRHITGSIITERDLRILERCNRDNIAALEMIVGVGAEGQPLIGKKDLVTVQALRRQGAIWADHVLENARAYIMTFLYIAVTVTTGWPIFSAIGYAAGVESEWLLYVLRFLDSLIYFWLPQINVVLIRLLQGRNLLHRMVGRTVIIGDCPWVAQSAEAFLSKLFACSYSIAGLNVHSANPADHLVHRYTHRVVRGSLLVAGRPDGRLMALTSLEASVLLSVNQASSIQSWEGRCESVTIGHNPFPNPLSANSIFLERHRPLFLCERVLDMTASPGPIIPPMSKLSVLISAKNVLSGVSDVGAASNSNDSTNKSSKEKPVARLQGMSSTALLGKYSTLKAESTKENAKRKSSKKLQQRLIRHQTEREDALNFSRHLEASRHSALNPSQHSRDVSRHSRDVSRHGRDHSRHGTGKRYGSAVSVTSFGMESVGVKQEHSPNHGMDVKDVLAEIQMEQVEMAVLERIYAKFANMDGYLHRENFIKAFEFIDSSTTPEEASKLFEEADMEDNELLDFADFSRLVMTPALRLQTLKSRNIRDHVGLVSIAPAEGKFFDDDMYKKSIPGVSKIALAKSENFSMELYESRIASLQRFVSMCTMFHEIGYRVQRFFSVISFGLWGYRIDRTHSIMRVATTASPASGAHVRKQMEVLSVLSSINRAVVSFMLLLSSYFLVATTNILRTDVGSLPKHTISAAWFRYKNKKVKSLLHTLKETKIQ